MKKKSKNLGLSLLLVALGAGGYALWQQLTLPSGSSTARKVLYYQDSMHPWIKSDQPGKCTVCAMDLTPIYEGEQGFGNTDNLVTLSSNSVTVLNVQTDEVRRRPLHRTLRVAGVLEADSTRKTIIAAPAPGRIDNVRVPSAGVDVLSGQVLATFYSPDLTFTTRRYIFRDRLTEHANQSTALSSALAGSSRHTPNAAPVPKNQPLASQERTDADPYFNDLLSTQAGTVTERNVFDGQYVAEGDRLFTIVDCSVLWFRFDVYEHQLSWLEPGQPVEVTVPSIPGRVFPAVISVIEPTLNETTRTAKVRADVSNPPVGTPGQQRRPLHLGMYADGHLRAQIPEALTVPRGAVLFPGGQAYAYLDKGGGAYEMRRVTLGRQGDDHWEILQGMAEGDRVVTSGNVLIDAQAQFNRSTGPVATAPPAQLASAEHGGAHAGATAGPEVGETGIGSSASAAGAMTEAQHQVLAGFLAVADGISSALASDNLDQLKLYLAKLSGVVQPLAKEFPDGHPWAAVIQRIETASHWPAPASLDAARKSFLPFSTNVVELVQRLRSDEESFASTKVFFCPMAPKPGLWFQSKGPLRNPYYGSKMLTCGEEVRPPAVTVKSQPQPLPVTSPRPPVAPPAASVTTPQHSTIAQAARPSQPAPPTLQTPPATANPTPAATPRTNQLQSATRRGVADFKQVAAALTARSADGASGLASSPMAGKAEAVPVLATNQARIVEAFVAVTDGLGQGLAADDLERYHEQLAKLPAVLAALEKEYPPPQRLNALVRRLAILTQGARPETLDEARKRFLLFSTNAVELAKQLRMQQAESAQFKIYHCPMAPPPGVWLQTSGPLRNPYFGAKMLTCGEEVEL
jgi:Cu(I)/Ag(I) efflux system membrane fusion protein